MRINPAGRDLYDQFSDESTWEFIGFTPNVQYIKEKASSKAEREACWVHPWGTITLLFKHKKLPLCVSVNAGMRFNKSFLHEMKFNRDSAPDLMGLSG